MINSVYKSLNSQALLVDIIVDIIDIPFTSIYIKTIQNLNFFKAKT